MDSSRCSALPVRVPDLTRPTTRPLSASAALDGPLSHQQHQALSKPGGVAQICLPSSPPRIQSPLPGCPIASPAALLPRSMVTNDNSCGIGAAESVRIELLKNTVRFAAILKQQLQRQTVTGASSPVSLPLQDSIDPVGRCRSPLQYQPGTFSSLASPSSPGSSPAVQQQQVRSPVPSSLRPQPSFPQPGGAGGSLSPAGGGNRFWFQPSSPLQQPQPSAEGTTLCCLNSPFITSTSHCSSNPSSPVQSSSSWAEEEIMDDDDASLDSADEEVVNIMHPVPGEAVAAEPLPLVPPLLSSPGNSPRLSRSRGKPLLPLTASARVQQTRSHNDNASPPSCTSRPNKRKKHTAAGPGASPSKKALLLQEVSTEQFIAKNEAASPVFLEEQQHVPACPGDSSRSVSQSCRASTLANQDKSDRLKAVSADSSESEDSPVDFPFPSTSDDDADAEGEDADDDDRHCLVNEDASEKAPDYLEKSNTRENNKHRRVNPDRRWPEQRSVVLSARDGFSGSDEEDDDVMSEQQESSPDGKLSTVATETDNSTQQNTHHQGVEVETVPLCLKSQPLTVVPLADLCTVLGQHFASLALTETRMKQDGSFLQHMKRTLRNTVVLLSPPRSPGSTARDTLQTESRLDKRPSSPGTSSRPSSSQSTLSPVVSKMTLRYRRAWMFKKRVLNKVFLTIECRPLHVLSSEDKIDIQTTLQYMCVKYGGISCPIEFSFV